MSKVEVGARIQNPEREMSFACKERYEYLDTYWAKHLLYFMVSSDVHIS